jgi:glycosyltransferase involved in cell wall biosynthesis
MVRNFPILEEFPPAPDIPWVERDPAVMFLGSMAWNRGIRELVEAIDLVPDNLNPKLRLLGPFHEPDLPPILEKLPGWARTEVMGVVPRERVSEMMNRVRAGMLPAHPSRMYMLAYPVKMFEYMAAGIPVIISDFPAWREFVETAQCGLLVDPLDPRDIAKAIEYILSHPVEAAAMGRNARKAMQTEFNWSHEEKTLLGLYERLSEGLPRRT